MQRRWINAPFAGEEELHRALSSLETHACFTTKPGLVPATLRVVHAEPPPAGLNTLAGRILDYGYLGDWTTYLVETAPGRTIRAARANATRTTDRPLGCDDPVWLTFAASSAVVLTR